VVELG